MDALEEIGLHRLGFNRHHEYLGDIIGEAGCERLILVGRHPLHAHTFIFPCDIVGVHLWFCAEHERGQIHVKLPFYTLQEGEGDISVSRFILQVVFQVNLQLVCHLFGREIECIS